MNIASCSDDYKDALISAFKAIRGSSLRIKYLVYHSQYLTFSNYFNLQLRYLSAITGMWEGNFVSYYLKISFLYSKV